MQDDQDHRRAWHSLSAEETCAALGTSEDGLSDDEAAKRLERYGRNTLHEAKRKSVWRMIGEQLSDIMVIILFIAMVFSLVMYFIDGEGLPEAIVIFAVITLNAAVGVIQEKKAADALAALKSMTAPSARAMRSGEESLVPASELVPGDVVYLEDGAIVPADIRLIEENNLRVQEASLTGESVPSEKNADAVLGEDTPLGDRANMVYSSSVVMYGNARGVVVETGMNTEVGKIADMLKTQDDFQTPIKKKLNSVGKILTVIGLAVCVIIMIIGFARGGRSWQSLVLLGISLAISIIPEGLPATATIIMAFGVQRMAKQNALVKTLPAVETLGSATVICCDKTGTLTLNKMTVTHLSAADALTSGRFMTADEFAALPSSLTRDLVDACALCGNAHLDPDRAGETIGDPTEGALLLFAAKFGIDADDYREAHEKIFEQPFDSDRKRMTTVNLTDRGAIAFTKGAVDEMLPLCPRILTSDGVREMTDADREAIAKVCNDMSAEALRVLGFAVRSVDPEKYDLEDDSLDLERDLTFVGVTGMIDPPRNEVIGAVETCHEAGIRVIMITGDHRDTAVAIAKQLHIFRSGNTVISGTELDEMTDDELDAAVVNATVFARVSPADKLRIIKSLRRTGEVAAMTGDGVNDSPALKEADIGVAMGVTGTDVAKDAADMILLDDDFTTIEQAVREGRRVYRNIQKVIQFLVAGNIAEILTLFLAFCFGWEDPILAIHILLINLATDSLPAIALGVDPADRNVMKVPPVKSGTLFERGVIVRIALHGLFITAAALSAYWIAEACYGSDPAEKHAIAMTMTFMTLALSQLVHAVNQRSNLDSIFRPGQGHNKYLYLAMVGSLVIIALVSFVPGIMDFFSLVYLDGEQYGIVLALALFPLVAVELVKLFARIDKKRRGKASSTSN